MAIQQTLKSTILVKSGGVPTATEVVTTTGLVLVNPKIKSGDYEDMGSGTLGNKKTYIDNQWVNAEFDIPTQVKKASALGVAPKLSNLFKLCGLVEVITPTIKTEYKTGGVTTGTGQAKSYVDGYVRTITGAVANLKLSGKVGEPLSAIFSLKGFLDNAQATAEPNPTVTLDTLSAPLVSKVSVLTVSGVTINADSFDFDLGNDIQEVYALGLSQYYIQNFDPTLSVTAVKTIGTDENAWADFGSGTVRAIIVQVGSEGGTIELSIPFAKLKDVSEADDAGKVKMSRTFRAEANAGNDNFVITYK